MARYNYNHGRFFGPSSSFTGYSLIAGGLIAMYFSLTALFVIIPGAFMAFTFSGCILDTDTRKVRPYTSLFGFIRAGKWIDIKNFTRFNIVRTTSKYSTYSRGSVRLDMSESDIRLLLTDRNGTKKVVLGRYGKFEDAQKEMERLNKIVFTESGIVKPETVK
jgi:hypothetical protein